MQNEFDIIIIGAGIVGLVFANLIAEQDLSIAIIDNNPCPKFILTEQYDLRVSAITSSSETILKQAACWDALANQRISPFRAMQIWDASGSGQIGFSALEIGQPQLGHIIENNLLLQTLTEQAQKKANVKFFYQTQLKKLIVEKEKASLELINQEKLTAKLIVGADGAKSWVRQQSNIPCEFYNYNHSALVTTVTTEKPHKETAYQRFLADGVLAFLPLAQKNLCSIVWSTQPEIAARLVNASESEFITQLNTACAKQLGSITAIDKRVSFPLFMQHAKDYVAPHIALIGDAAHTIHPLAGQGLNLGIADAAALAELINLQIRQQCSIADFALLKKYQRQRKTENMLMIETVTNLKRLFSNTFEPVIFSRNLGLNIVNKIAPLKNFFMANAG